MASPCGCDSWVNSCPILIDIALTGTYYKIEPFGSIYLKQCFADCYVAVSAFGGGVPHWSRAMDEDISDRRKWRQIIDGARQVFLELGFDGASIGDIVKAAGVSRGTLYAYFPSKEKLFETLIFEDRRLQAERLFTLDLDNPDMRSELHSLGVRFVQLVMDPVAISHLRTVIAIAARFPDIGRAFYEAGPLFGIQKVSAYLRVQCAAGRLDIPDLEAAAGRFMDLCKSGLHIRLLMGMEDSIGMAEIEANVTEAVETFLARYERRADA